MNSTNLTGNDLPETRSGAAGEAGTVPKENAASSAKSPENGKKKPFLATRVTALRGGSIVPRRVAQSTIRHDTMADLNQKDPEVPYLKAEKAIRDLVCSILERQDRMNEVILCRVIDLQYRMDDLEAVLPEEEEQPGEPAVKE